MANNVRTVGTLELARHTNLQPQRINQYVQEGMPKKARNKFDLDACCRWIQDYREQKFNEQIAESADAQEKYYLAQADRTNINAERDRDKLMRERGELIHVAEVNPTISRIVVAVKDALLSIESKLAPQIGADNARKVGEHHREILNQLADEANRMTGTKAEKHSKPRKRKSK